MCLEVIDAFDTDVVPIAHSLEKVITSMYVYNCLTRHFVILNDCTFNNNNKDSIQLFFKM